jgi:hydroxymethylpyrimidine/phosphomethylpyrimidine kinase
MHSYKISYISLPIVQNQTPPLILTFGAADPIGAIGVHADLATFSAMGCHGMPVLTSILVGDTSQVDDTHALEAELVSDQARTVLEDVQVVACTVGLVGSVENVTIIAEIVSDYPELHLVLDPFNSAIPDLDTEKEDLLLAICELLIPQSTVLVISTVDLSLLSETWKETDAPDEANDMIADAMALIESGCEFVLVTGATGKDNTIANVLIDNSGIVRTDEWQRIQGSHLGASSTLSAAIAAMLANGLDVAEAVMEAQEFTFASITHAQRLGMGKLVPDRYFWTKETQEPE